MAQLQLLLDAVETYQNTFRHPKLPKFEISELYCLFPDENWTGIKWPTTYEHTGRCGVYLMLPDENTVNYVGKTSMSSNFGSRLGSYFGYTDDRKGCRLWHEWETKPRFLLTIAVPETMEFEAPALEEYLIREIPDGLENRMGIQSTNGG